MRRWRPPACPSTHPLDAVARARADEALRRARATEMVEVLLVGPDESPADDGAQAGDGAPDGVRRVRRDRDGHDPRTRRRWPVAAAAVVGVLLVAGAVRAALPERAPDALPVVDAVASLAEPLVARWDVEAPSGATRAGGLVVVLPARGTGDRLAAVDVRTGRTRWTVPTDGDRGVAWCEGEVHARATTLVACWRLPADEARVVLLDAVDGSVVADRPAGTPTAGHGVVDGDLVLTRRDGGDLLVRRLEPGTGAERWSVRVRSVGRPVGGLNTAWVEVAHGWVVLHGTTSAVLDAADGRLLGVWRSGTVPAAELLERARAADVATAPHGFGVWPDVVSGTRAPLGTWFGADGRERGVLDGFLVEPEVSDGSVPDAVLTQAGAGVRATDVGAGRELWRSAGTPVARAGGLAVLADRDGLVAVELATGDLAWSAPVPASGRRPGW